MGNISQKNASGTHGEPVKESIVPLVGVVISEMKRCGKANCHCASGQLHGPYHYRYYREGGKLTKRYVRPADLGAVMGATQARQRLVKDSNKARSQLRLLLATLKGAGLWVT